jgi:mannose-6-phosphate isomerase-like protein (cupin superfamily)
MGKVVTFASLPYKEVSAGVKSAAITGSDGKEMQAEVIRLAPGAQLAGQVPQGSDRYFFTMTGETAVAGNGGSHRMSEESFATVQEGMRFTLSNGGKGEAEILSVYAPPPGSARKRPGATGGITVAERAKRPVVEIPEAKKRRIYFVDKAAVQSERAHAMIVLYEQETVTNMHKHPDAESMFVILTGKVRFTVNGQEVVVERGQATHFPTGDRHGLRVAEGNVSFLEFHIPAGYTTVHG